MTLTIANISKKLNKKPVIENASFQINEGEIVGLVGRNGAGKTTLFRIISGEILPDFGSVGLDDQDYHRMVALHDQLFYVDMPNNWMTNFNSQQVKRIVQASYENFDTSWYDQQITRFKLDGRQKLKQYSKGMRALFTLIVSFASNAQYVLLDEPLDGLDVLVRDEVKRLIVERVTNQNTSVLIASHNLVELDTLTDRILLLKNGTIIRSFEVD
ncbi:MAG: ABC transporter ATP-binding protein, partial [Leuconostoc fallax]